MRVVLLLGRSAGGIGTHVRDLDRGLRRLGTDVEVVTDASTADRFGLEDAHRGWPDRRAPLATVRAVRALRRRARRADVLHAHGHQAGLLAAVATAGLRPGPALVVSLHNAVLPTGGGPVRRRARRLLTRASEAVVARRADLVTGASSDLVERAAALGARRTALAPVPSPRVPGLLAAPAPDDAARAGLAAGLLREHGLAPDRPLVVTVSRVAPQKDLPTLLRAAARLEHPVTWCVLGDGDPGLGRRLADAARAEGLPVHLLGAVPDPAPWLRAADVFVLTSTWEARALVVQEAMAAGTPVVCTDVGGLHDLVAGVGRLVPLGDAAAVAAAVDALVGDPAARAAAAGAGRARAAGWADSAESARRWGEEYARVRAMT